MAAGSLDITMEQGGTFDLVLDVYDENGIGIDLSGWTPTMRIVHRASGAVTVIGSGVGVMSVDTSTITITIPHATTATLEAESEDYTPRQYKNRDTKYAYEVSVTNGSDVKKIVRGNLLVARGI